MIDGPAAWLFAIGGGGAIAALYFAGLWWTVQRAARASHPLLIVAGSFLFRGMLAAALLVALAGPDPWRLLAALGGFLLVRTLVVGFARGRPSALTPRPSRGEG